MLPLFPRDNTRILEFAYKQNNIISVGLKMTESLLCPADEVSRLEMGRLMRFSQSVRLVV